MTFEYISSSNSGLGDEEMIYKLPGKLQKHLQTLLQPGEEVKIQLQGVGKQALICTSMRVMILKSGWTKGSTFGVSTFQALYDNITSVDVKGGLTSGYIEISAGGVQNKTFELNAAASQAPNCVFFSRRDKDKFNVAAGAILSFKQSKQEVVSSTPFQEVQSDPTDEIFQTIEKLGGLLEKNYITQEEFEEKKKVLLSRL